MSGLAPWSEPLRPEWIDYNGHLSEGYYVLVFGHATDSVMAQIGMTPEYLVETGTSLYTVEAHVRYLDQIPPGATLEVRSSVIGRGAKTLWLWHELWLDGRLRDDRRAFDHRRAAARHRGGPHAPRHRR